MNKPLNIRVGQTVGGVEILDITPSTYRRDYRYHVRYLCCGRDGEISHARLARRIQLGERRCKYCAQAGAERQKPFARDFGARGVRDGFGHVWPVLGKLGPRWCDR